MAKVLEVTIQVSMSASGSWSVMTTLMAVPAPGLETLMVKEAVSPGWMTVWLAVTVFTMDSLGSVSTKGVPVRSPVSADWVKVTVRTLGSSV